MLRLAHQVGSLVASSRNPSTVLRLASPPPQPPSSSSTSSNPLRMNMESTRNSEGSSHGENTNSSQQKEDNLEVHGQWNQNGEAAPLTAERVRSAAKAGFVVAATKAKLFADHEEREIQRLSANIINHQERRLKELFDSIHSLDELHALYSKGLRADVIVVDDKDKKLSMLKQLTVTLVKGLNSNLVAVIKKIAGLIRDVIWTCLVIWRADGSSFCVFVHITLHVFWLRCKFYIFVGIIGHVG